MYIHESYRVLCHERARPRVTEHDLRQVSHRLPCQDKRSTERAGAPQISIVNFITTRMEPGFPFVPQAMATKVHLNALPDEYYETRLSDAAKSRTDDGSK